LFGASSSHGLARVAPQIPAEQGDADDPEDARITGTVTSPTSAPLSGIRVRALRLNTLGGWSIIRTTVTEPSGAFALETLPADTYHIEFHDPSGDHITEYYDDSLTIQDGADVVVVASAHVSDINAQLAVASKITGFVTGPHGEPLEGIRIRALRNVEGGWQGTGDYTSAHDGAYEIGGLVADTYYLWFRSSESPTPWVEEYYDDQLSIGTANGIPLAPSSIVTDINAQLAGSSFITGVVTGPENTPLPGIWVIAYRQDVGSPEWQNWKNAVTDVNGVYTLSSLAPDTYRLRFFDPDGEYLVEVYDDAPDIESANDLELTAGATITNVNAQLASASMITGVITGPDGAPRQNIQARAFHLHGAPATWKVWRIGYSEADGSYTIGDLPANTYRVGFYDDSGALATEFYADKSTIEDANEIVVGEASTVGNISAQLFGTAQITGVVTGADGKPATGIDVTAYSWEIDTSQWTPLVRAETAADGSYTVVGLLAGNYRLGFRDSVGVHVEEYYNDRASLVLADEITVGASNTVGNVNAQLALATYSVNGKVTFNDAGLSGVTVLAGDTTAETDIGGAYTISGLVSGDYTVTPSLAGFTFTPPLRQVTLGGDAHNIDFAATTTPSTYSLGGRITLDGSGLEGVTITIDERVAQSDSSGAFTFASLPAFTYTVVPSLAGHHFEPAQRTVVVAANTADIDFSAIPDLPAGVLHVLHIEPAAPANGDFTTPAGQMFAVDVSAGTVGAKTSLYFRLPETLPGGLPTLKFGGVAIQIDAYQNGAPIEDFTFLQPITLTIGYDDEDIAGLTESEIVVRHYDPVVGTWHDAGVEIVERDLPNNRIIFKIGHLTLFALANIVYPVYLPTVD